MLSSPTFVPLQALSARSPPVLLHRITSEESLSSLASHGVAYPSSPLPSHGAYPTSPLSEQGERDGEEDSGSRSHTSSASSLASLSSQTPAQQRRAAAHVSPTSFLPPAALNSNSSSSPRKRQDALHHSASASNSTAAPLSHTTAPLAAPRGSPSSVSPVLPTSSVSPLSQRYGRYGASNSNNSAVSPSKQMMQQQPSPQLQPQPAQPHSARSLSSTSAHAHSASSIRSGDLPPPSRSLPSAASKHRSSGGGGSASGGGPVRAHHLAGSSSASNMAAFLASGAESDSSALPLRSGHSVFSASAHSPPSNPIYNIWSRDTSANKGSGAGSAHRTNGATTSKNALRPSSSHSAHRPVTARADLLSARDDSMPHGPVTGKHNLSANPYAASYNAQRPSAAANHEPRMHTATVNSLGAQARARSAHVLRPPSRQRPPNQALHLESGEGQVSQSSGTAESASAASAVRASSALRASQWASSAADLNSGGPNGRPVSGGRSHVHALTSSTDLFPAAPTQLVKAVKQQLRTMTAGSKRESASARSLHATLQAQAHSSDHLAPHHAHTHSSGGSGTEPSGISGLVSGGSGSSDYDSYDTDNTDADAGSSLETETDGGGDSTNTDEDTSGGAAAATGSFVGALDPSNFVSLRNILQLQSETVGKSMRLGSAGSSRKHLLMAAFPERPAGAAADAESSESDDDAHIIVESRVRTPASRSAHHSAHHSSGVGGSAEDDPFPRGPHSRSSSMGSSRPNSRPGSSRRGLSAGKTRR